MGGGVFAAGVVTALVVLAAVALVRRTMRADRAVGEVGDSHLASWHHGGLSHGGRSDDDRWPG